MPKEIEVGFILIAPQTRDVVPGCLPVRFQRSAEAILLPVLEPVVEHAAAKDEDYSLGFCD
jgi:hypothetical protein